jgi:hypothetical protein
LDQMQVEKQHLEQMHEQDTKDLEAEHAAAVAAMQARIQEAEERVGEN